MHHTQHKYFPHPFKTNFVLPRSQIKNHRNKRERKKYTKQQPTTSRNPAVGIQKLPKRDKGGRRGNGRPRSRGSHAAHLPAVHLTPPRPLASPSILQKPPWKNRQIAIRSSSPRPPPLLFRNSAARPPMRVAAAAGEAPLLLCAPPPPPSSIDLPAGASPTSAIAPSSLGPGGVRSSSRRGG